MYGYQARSLEHESLTTTMQTFSSEHEHFWCPFGLVNGLSHEWDQRSLVCPVMQKFLSKQKSKSMLAVSSGKSVTLSFWLESISRIRMDDEASTVFWIVERP